MFLFWYRERCIVLLHIMSCGHNSCPFSIVDLSSSVLPADDEFPPLIGFLPSVVAFFVPYCFYSCFVFNPVYCKHLINGYLHKVAPIISMVPCYISKSDCRQVLLEPSVSSFYSIIGVFR